MSKMQILITGSNGFIGSHLNHSLIKKKIDTYDITRDEMNNFSLLQSMNNISANMLIHLASNAFIPDSFDDPSGVYLENYKSTLSALEICRRYKIKKFIYFSSYVYGSPEYLPVDENHPTSIKNPYGRSKLHGEFLCHAYAEDYDMDITILRPFNIYGEGQKSKFLFPTIIRQLLDPEVTYVTVENTNTKRDYLYIKDLISLLNKIIFSSSLSGVSSFNVGFGESYSVDEILKKMMKIFGIEKEIIDKGSKRKNEVMDCYADNTKIKEFLSWEPKYNIDRGLKDLKESLKSY